MEKSFVASSALAACLTLACAARDEGGGQEEEGRLGQDGAAGVGTPEFPPLEARPAAGGVPLNELESLGEGVAVANLTVWPVFAKDVADLGEYLTLADAVAAGLATIREQEDAQVGALTIENRADRPILACSGTVVKGGRQDRQIGVDTVILAGATQSVRAFCVEPGRWNEVREGRRTRGVFEPVHEMAAKRVRASAQYDEDQGQVWSQVGLLANAVFEVQSPLNAQVASSYYLACTTDSAPPDTHAAALEHASETTRAMRRRMAAAVEDHFESLDGSRLVGFAYAIDGEPVAARTFAAPDLFASRLDAFLATMCFEAEVAQRQDLRAGREVADEPASVEALLAMVRGIETEALRNETASRDVQVEKRSNGFGGNSVCSVRVPGAEGDRWVALTRDWTAPVRFGAEAAKVMGTLCGLGYTGD